MKECLTQFTNAAIKENRFDFSFLEEKDSVDKYGFGLLLGLVQSLSDPTLPQSIRTKRIDFIKSSLENLTSKQISLAMGHIRADPRLLREFNS